MKEHQRATYQGEALKDCHQRSVSSAGSLAGSTWRLPCSVARSGRVTLTPAAAIGGYSLRNRGRDGVGNAKKMPCVKFLWSVSRVEQTLLCWVVIGAVLGRGVRSTSLPSGYPQCVL